MKMWKVYWYTDNRQQEIRKLTRVFSLGELKCIRNKTFTPFLQGTRAIFSVLSGSKLGICRPFQWNDKCSQILSSVYRESGATRPHRKFSDSSRKSSPPPLPCNILTITNCFSSKHNMLFLILLGYKNDQCSQTCLTWHLCYTFFCVIPHCFYPLLTIFYVYSDTKFLSQCMSNYTGFTGHVL